jgi:hypothetical protein
MTVPFHITDGSGLRSLEYDLLPPRSRTYWISRRDGIELPAPTFTRPATWWRRLRDCGDGVDAQGVALPAPDGHALVERGAFGGSQFGGAEEVGDHERAITNRQVRTKRPLPQRGVIRSQTPVWPHAW